MRENAVEIVYAAEWPGFPGETAARREAQADLRVVDETFHEPPSPDWQTMAKIFKQEETAAFNETDESPIYNYEIEIQKPLPPLEAISERVSLRQRAKRIMGRAGDAIRETSISAAAAVQAKAEAINNYYEDDENGNRRQKASAAVAGTLLLGGLAYLELKGVSGSTTVIREAHSTAVEHSVARPAQEHVHHLTSLRLHSGENPWTVTEDQLHAHGVAHPSDARIAADDQRLMKLNHISKLQALKLQVGTKLKLLKIW